MQKSYRYEVSGSAAGGQSWKTEGSVISTFELALVSVMVDSFRQLTGGRAVYGRPGEGCNGPYDIHRVVIEQIRH
jgi:hypothetical protein